MVAVLSGVCPRSATKASPAHFEQELVTRTSGVNIHRSRLRRWRNKRGVREGSSSRGGCNPGYESGMLPFAISLGAALTDANIDIRCNYDQLFEGADGTSRVDKCVFDAGGKMLVEAISEVNRGVPGACH